MKSSCKMPNDRNKNLCIFCILYSVVTPYNHSTYYYNELLNSGRQVSDSFYAYVGRASNSDDWRLLGWFPGWFLAASDDFSFCLLWGTFCFIWVLHSKASMWCSSLWWRQRFCWCLHLGWFLGDRCCARTLDPCVSSFVMIPRVFSRIAP